MENGPNFSSLLKSSTSNDELHLCSLTVTNVTSETITVKYAGIPGNQPKDYKNFVAIWESTLIPWNSEPIRKEYIPQNSEAGDFVISDLSITKGTYILGYAVGDSITNICVSTNILPINNRIEPPAIVSISLAAVGNNSVTINYTTLAGYLPAICKNWIGLWEGYATPFNSVAPLGFANITSNSNQGVTGINNVAIENNMVYTLVYFMGSSKMEGWPKSITNAGALLYFQTGNPTNPDPAKENKLCSVILSNLTISPKSN